MGASALLIVGGIALPLSARALTLEELQSQVAKLLVQVSTLQTQLLLLSASTTADVLSSNAATAAPIPAMVPGSCPLIARTLTVGVQGDDVSSLQAYLIAHGMLTAGSATGYFGPLTQAAVRQWQSENGVVSSGDAATTGWGVVGAKTRAALTSICGGAPVPSSDTLSIHSAGLTSTATLTINAKGSCGAHTYTLNWGDGSQTESYSVPASSCAPSRPVYTHAYTQAGSYTVTLSSGGRTAQLPITVATGAPVTTTADCPVPYIFATTLPSATVGATWSVPVLTNTIPTTVTMIGAPTGIAIAHTEQADTNTLATSSVWSLDGVPAAAGTYTMSITAQNRCGSNQKTVLLTVNSAASVTPTPKPNPTPLSCPVYMPALCTSGTLVSQGTDANGCQLPAKCVVNTACPVYMPALCTNGVLVSQGTDANGCQLPAKCVPTLSCTIVDCIQGYHPSGPSCSANQTCIPN